MRKIAQTSIPQLCGNNPQEKLFYEYFYLKENIIIIEMLR